MNVHHNQTTLFGVPACPCEELPLELKTPFPEKTLLALFERLGEAIVAGDARAVLDLTSRMRLEIRTHEASDRLPEGEL